VPLDSPKAKLSSKLRQYIRGVRPADASSPHLFLQTRRNGGEYTPLTRRGLQILMQRLGERTGIHVHPHKFRHTFATRSLAAGVDVMALQRVLGHTTLAMVRPVRPLPEGRSARGVEEAQGLMGRLAADLGKGSIPFPGTRS
jgi:integrase/recombinase XerC